MGKRVDCELFYQGFWKILINFLRTNILPKADTGDSSLNNLVLAHKTCNETKKAKRIPYEAFGHDKLWPQIEQYLDEQLVAKAWRFNLSLEEYEDYLANNSFSHRFASDNAYIARVACKYLQCLYPKEKRLKSVKTIRGGETAVLRNAWHLNGITSSLSEALCVRKEPGYESKKNRDDFRHHALDAIVIAMFTPQYSSIIESLVSRGYSRGEVFSRLPIPKFYRTSRDLSTGNQIKQFSKEIEDFIFNNTFVSIKHSTNRNGELFKESRYSILALGSDDVMLCKRVSVFDINVASIEGTSTKTLEGLLKKGFSFPPFINEKEKQKADNLKKINSKKFDEILSYIPTAKKCLEDANIELEASGKKANEITDKKIIGFACKKVGGIYYQVSNRKIDKVFLLPSIMSAFDTGQNYCLDLYYGECGKVCAEVIRKANAVKHDYIPRYKMKGYHILERLYPKDVLEINLQSSTSTDKKALSQSFLSPNAPVGRTFIVVDKFTESGKSVRVWYYPLVTVSENVSTSFMVNGISKLFARKVVLSSLGLVVYRSRLLRDLENVESD